tara:strand:- start:4572 stop:4715 length:144 start_codon:yes stop_codon:yes gene_type:complete
LFGELFEQLFGSGLNSWREYKRLMDLFDFNQPPFSFDFAKSIIGLSK